MYYVPPSQSGEPKTVWEFTIVGNSGMEVVTHHNGLCDEISKNLERSRHNLGDSGSTHEECTYLLGLSSFAKSTNNGRKLLMGSRASDDRFPAIMG
ncbi:hypothetical protein OSB04_023824 [Centaurea solstitialis]|uniref:Uncharacterized protein n=1 Tax=Centaurea solstitialis TaxID=347529 RepID=A0AA38W016_9ASTR|nr:hypothetical protein OSB04_023824 [Centaurea solstitialis]